MVNIGRYQCSLGTFVQSGFFCLCFLLHSAPLNINFNVIVSTSHFTAAIRFHLTCFPSTSTFFHISSPPQSPSQIFPPERSFSHHLSSFCLSYLSNPPSPHVPPHSSTPRPQPTHAANLSQLSKMAFFYSLFLLQCL